MLREYLVQTQLVRTIVTIKASLNHKVNVADMEEDCDRANPEQGKVSTANDSRNQQNTG